jgi:hypothetical protein
MGAFAFSDHARRSSIIGTGGTPVKDLKVYRPPCDPRSLSHAVNLWSISEVQILSYISSMGSSQGGRAALYCSQRTVGLVFGAADPFLKPWF